MRIEVAHETIYRYGAPAHLEPHTFRLRPRCDGSQRVIEFQLEIAPEPVGRSECLDAEGNVVTEAWFAGETTQMAVRSRFTVETLRENPFDYLGGGALGEDERAALGRYLRRDGSEAVAELVRGIGERPAAEFLGELNRRIFEGIEYVVREDGAPADPKATLAARSGSCRDLAVLFCAAAREAGIPARFVSGYADAGQGRRELHAWSEVYVAGGGWRGYDPSQGLAVSTGHVAIAAAAEAAGAAPVVGTFRGAGRARMEFRIEMRALTA